MTPPRLLTALIAMAPALALADGAPSRVSLSLEDAFRQALKANPAVGRARAEVSASGAQKHGALASILPHVSASGAYIRNSTEVAFVLAGNSRLVLPLNDWNLRLTLNQPVFAGLREQRAYEQTKLVLEGARQGFRGAEDQVLLRVAADYLSLVGGAALVEIEDKNGALAERRRDQAQALFDAGETTRVDVLRADADVKAARRRLASAEQVRDTAAGRLRVDLALEGDFEVQEPGRIGPPLPPLDDLLSRADQRRVEVEQARTQLAIADLEVKKQQGAYLPVITADAGYIWQKTSFPVDKYGYAALRFTMPLFESGETGARIAVARERKRQAELTLDEVRRTVREDVRKALLDLDTADKGLGLAEEQLRAAEAEYAQAFELYKSQETTSLDVQSAENALAEGRRAVLSSRLDRTLAQLQVWFAAGSLKTEAVKEVQP